MPGYSNNVFINCPFDDEYKPLLRVIIFVTKTIGLTPRLASERADSGEVRLQKIKELIEESKYSVHDLSRCQASQPGEYSRMNMPFELGLDLGCRYYHPESKYRGKKQLILESDRYSTQRALSDLSFANCESHENDAEKLVYRSGDFHPH